MIRIILLSLIILFQIYSGHSGGGNNTVAKYIEKIEIVKHGRSKSDEAVSIIKH